VLVFGLSLWGVVVGGVRSGFRVFLGGVVSCFCMVDGG